MTDFSFVFNYAVRIADINYGGHVSNAAVLAFFQEARIAFLASLGPYSEVDIGEGRGLILPEAQVKYLAEMFHGDSLSIGVRVGEVKRSSFILEYQIERGTEIVVTGQTAMVSFDYERRKAVRLPAVFRQHLLDA